MQATSKSVNFSGSNIESHDLVSHFPGIWVPEKKRINHFNQTSHLPCIALNYLLLLSHWMALDDDYYKYIWFQRLKGQTCRWITLKGICKYAKCETNIQPVNKW